MSVANWCAVKSGDCGVRLLESFFGKASVHDKHVDGAIGSEDLAIDLESALSSFFEHFDEGSGGW